MSKAVLLAIRPEWCHLIRDGKKTLEVRKTKPKLETPFKCYIYCTKGDPSDAGDDFWLHDLETFRSILGNGKVIGEFVCDDCSLLTKAHYGYIEQYGCLNREALNTYMGILGRELSDSDGCYGWHISELRIYNKPKYLSEFTGLRKTKFGLEPIRIRRAPQSWCYVEEENGGAVFK